MKVVKLVKTLNGLHSRAWCFQGFTLFTFRKESGWKTKRRTRIDKGRKVQDA